MHIIRMVCACPETAITICERRKVMVQEGKLKNLLAIFALYNCNQNISAGCRWKIK